MDDAKWGTQYFRVRSTSPQESVGRHLPKPLRVSHVYCLDPRGIGGLRLYHPAGSLRREMCEIVEARRQIDNDSRKACMNRENLYLSCAKSRISRRNTPGSP